MQPFWVYRWGAGYPGGGGEESALDVVLFSQTYSGHNPVVLGVIPTAGDED